ncbi:unnamed protein product [Urochloa decumbens]|uniref:J domain-containing protein n=1 Tax=Urochloa decumbens TaxID=240449 RepID=A0ABC8X4W0_9POAL
MAGAGRERERDADAAAAKAQAAREVCAASAAFASCPHRRRSPRGGRPHFVDWYLVLAIGEAASEDAVRRRYRQLALQLHPDKNRHPKAEVAFKIVSEAHACLTDKARRRAFDAERRASFCAACHDRHAARSSSSPSPAGAGAGRPRAAADKQRAAAGTQAASASRTKQPRAAPAALREVQNRLRDECRVIDGCLRAHNAAACARRRQSFPLFDPSDRRRFPDYPHVRPPPFGSAELWRFEERLGRADQNGQNQRWCRGGGESPIYQIRTPAAECTDRTRRAW